MRTSQIKLSMEFMDSTRTDSICRHDAEKFGEDVDKYIKANEAQYYLSINVWLGMIDDTFHRGTRYRVTQYIWENGLRATIDLSCRTADHIIAWLSRENPGPADEEVVQWESLFPVNDVRSTLTCLRFLKRFTVDASRTLEAASYQKFSDLQQKLNWRKAARSVSKDPDVTIPNNKWVPAVASYMHDLLRLWDEFYSHEVGEFGNGACSDGKTVLEKIRSYATYSYNRGGCQLYPLYNAVREVDIYMPDVIKVNGVPKSYKAYRIIAPETAFGSYYQQRLRKAIIHSAQYGTPDWWPYIDVESQDRQRDRAYLGSLDNTFVTYDLSGASDSIALYWMYRVMCYYADTPMELLYHTILDLRAPKVDVGGTTMVLSSFLTSGNACTFILETMFFWSLAMVACDLHYEWTGEKVLYPTSFGDDMIVDSRCQGELETIYDAFGLVINKDKSFTSGDYRESCGVEFWKGQPVHSRYWPRARILTTKKATSSDYASLVALQHKVYEEYPTAAMILEEAVLFWWPQATKSSPGILDVEESTDLWSAFPTRHLKKAPYGAYWKDPKPVFPEDAPEWMYREAHSGLRSVQTSDRDWRDLVNDYDADTIETWLYAEFLMHGPRFASPLDELLGVSEPRTRVSLIREPELTVALLT